MTTDTDTATHEPQPPPATDPVDDSFRHALAHLERWARTWGVEDDPYVQAMLTGRLGPYDTAAWVSQDPLELLPHPEPTSRQVLRSTGVFRRLANGVSGLRNLLVFVPVAITWWAIYEATTAFNAMRDAGPEVETTFLDVWVTGAGDPTAMWAIQRIALVDAAIIAGIVGLTFLAGALHSVNERSLVKRQIAADRARTETAMLLAVALDARRTATPEVVEETMTRLVRTLSGAASRLAAASESLERSASETADHMLHASERLDRTSAAAAATVEQTADQLNGVAVEVAGLGSGLGAVEGRLGHLADRVDAALSDPLQRAQASIADLSNTVATLTAGLESDQSRYLQGFTDTLSTVTGDIQKAGTSLEFGTLRLRDDLESLSALLDQISEKVSS